MDRARGRCAVIVNADIEMRINAPELKALMGQAEPSGIFWFRRINHAPGDAIGRPEEWGIDIFVSDCWPNLGDSGGLRLGAPWWDYWLPVAAIKHGIPLYTVTDQQWFWHEDHDDRWSEWDWLQTGIETVRLHELMRPGAVSWTALDCLARELCGRVFPAHTTVMRP